MLIVKMVLFLGCDAVYSGISVQTLSDSYVPDGLAKVEFCASRN